MEQEKDASGLAMLLAGAAIGAAAMYFSDPKQGRRRRALLRDKLYSVSLDVIDARDATLRDMGNRFAGAQAKLRQAMEGNVAAPSDEVLGARVRTLLGRVVSHPHAISVTAKDGHVVLSGAILADERETLLAEAYKVPGVIRVADRLKAYASPLGVPALQGHHSVSSQKGWQPALQALAGAGGILGVLGITRRSSGGLLLAGTGLAVLGRAMMAMRRDDRLDQQQAQQELSATSHLERSIEVLATPEAVFDAWSDFENFPHFFAKVLTAKAQDTRRARWVIQESGDSRLEGTVVWRQRERPRLLAWQSEADASFTLGGTIALEATARGTRVRVKLSMPQQTGAPAGEASIRLYQEIERELDKDLLRMKSFIESGVVTHHATGSTRPEGGQLLH